MRRIFSCFIYASLMMIASSCSDDSKENATSRLIFDFNPTEAYVDLGLSVNWATCNLGAAKPLELGDTYAWGETVPKVAGTYKGGYKWSGRSGGYTKYNDKAYVGVLETPDNKKVLDPEDDAAACKIEGARIPTEEEWMELFDNCAFEPVERKGKYFLYFRSNAKGCEGNSILLPLLHHQYDFAYSDYWTSNLADNASMAQYAYLDYIYPFRKIAGKAREHLSYIRPVYPK